MLPYFILLIVAFILSRSFKDHNWALLFLFVFMSLFVGLRYDVGTDYVNYSIIYDSYTHYLEIAFQYIVTVLRKYNLPAHYMFLVFATITYGFMFAGIYKNNKIEKFPTTFMLSLFPITFICNGIRQAAAISIFFFASRFIQNRKWYLYFPLILFAYLFHKSILICLPLYFLNDFYFTKKQYVIIYLVSFIFITMDLQSIMQPFMFLIEENERYLNLMDDNRYTSGYFSLGIFLQIVNYIILFTFCLKNDIETKYPLWFNFFFILIVLMNMRVASPLFNRVQVIFQWFIYIILPLTIKLEPKTSTRYTLILYFTASFCTSMIRYVFFDPLSNMYPYSFVFE